MDPEINGKTAMQETIGNIKESMAEYVALHNGLSQVYKRVHKSIAEFVEGEWSAPSSPPPESQVSDPNYKPTVQDLRECVRALDESIKKDPPLTAAQFLAAKSLEEIKKDFPSKDMVLDMLRKPKATLESHRCTTGPSSWDPCG